MGFSCYLDDSYSSGNVISLAGYFATSDNWAAYEASADDIYRQHNISILHTTDLHATKRQFRGWPLTQKKAFLADLFEAASQSKLVGISNCTTKSLSRTFQQVHKATAQISALGALFGSMVKTVCDNEGLMEISGPRDVSFVIEKGNKNNAGILTTYNKLRSEGKLQRAKSLSFVGKADCKAIHLADFWAFYSRRIATKLLQSKFQLPGSDSAPFDKLVHGAFDKLPHTVNITYGGVSSILGHPDLLQYGELQTFHFGPMRR